MPRLSKKDAAIVLAVCETITRRNDLCMDLAACAEAVKDLRQDRPVFEATSLYWLGSAFCQHDILEWPVIAPRDRPGFDGAYRHLREELPMHCCIAWYWDRDVVLWGCREYLRRRGEKVPR